MNKYRSIIVSLLILLVSFSYSQGTSGSDIYQYSVNLNKIKDHKLPVTLITPRMDKDEVIFRMPKMVPGTYHEYDFGRFVSGFRAYDNEGNRLPVTKIDNSSWKISDAESLAKITYKVRETWHPKDKENFVFEPVGTNFDIGKNYVLNANAVFGYFDDMKRLKYDVSITKPLHFYASTAMIPVQTDSIHDDFVTPDYYELVDMPIMYTIPDTTIFRVGHTQILISVYSEGGIITSKMLAGEMKKLVKAQDKYFNGNMPVKKYAYLIYFDDHTNSGSAGALEHNQSSLYYLVEGDTQGLLAQFVIFASHEFLHIITPLSIHSEQIENFDYAHPKMSEHLWLYEGVTEYSAGIVMLRGGLMDKNQFLDFLRNKIIVSQYFNDTLPFTVMSKNVLNKYENQYVNVYQKGALIAACLDIELRSLSEGKYSLKDLMNELSKMYGKDHAFKDDSLFDIITGLTYPEIRKFFAEYVEGPEPLPYKEIFGLVGVDYAKSEKKKAFTLGNIGINIDPGLEHVVITQVADMNDFGKEMGYKKGDEIVSINGKKLVPSHYREFIDELFTNSKEGEEMAMEVLRKDENGNEKTVTLKAPMTKVERKVENTLEYNPDASEHQLKLRKAWLGVD
jgi:predicted metalloprotease with PDZ domain